METPVQVATDHLFFLDWQMLWSAFAVWGFGSVLLSTVLTQRIAMLVMALKVIIPVAFFTLFFQPEWQVGGDDQGYFMEALYFYELGLNPIEIFGHSHPWYILRTDPGRAFFYYYLFLGLYFLGGSYYSAILLNVLVTALATVFLTKAIADLDRRPQFAAGLALFLTLHWSVIAWSSFLLLKEPLITCLLCGVIFGISSKQKALELSKAIVGLTCLFLLLWVRYYFPPLLVIAIAGGLFLTIRSNRKWAALLLLPLAFWHGFDEIRYFFSLVDLKNVSYGIVHFLLQPMPTRITEPVEFLRIPAILNWGFALFGVLGAFGMFFQRHRTSVSIVLIVAITALFYALVPDLASTRHRAPIEILVAVLQYYGLWFLFLIRLPSIHRQGSSIFQAQNP